MEPRPIVSRRRFLAWSAAAATTLVACQSVPRPSMRTNAAAATSTPSSAVAATASPSASVGSAGAPAPSEAAPPSAGPGRTIYRDGALADGRSDRLTVGVSILVENGRIAWIRPSGDEPDPGSADGLEIVDASGATFVPGMVDGHAHVTLPGGAHWIDRIGDPPARLQAVAEHNGRLMTAAGVRWARDVGAPYVDDPVDGRRRALSLGVRDRWRDRPGFPHIRAAGTWLDRAGTLPPAAHTVEANTARRGRRRRSRGWWPRHTTEVRG